MDRRINRRGAMDNAASWREPHNSCCWLCVGRSLGGIKNETRSAAKSAHSCFRGSETATLFPIVLVTIRDETFQASDERPVSES